MLRRGGGEGLMVPACVSSSLCDEDTISGQLLSLY